MAKILQIRDASAFLVSTSPYSPHVQQTKESDRNTMLLHSKIIHDERDDCGIAWTGLVCDRSLFCHRELFTVFGLEDCFGNVNIRLLVKHVTYHMAWLLGCCDYNRPQMDAVAMLERRKRRRNGQGGDA
jgi:hypothetical protein